MNKIHHSFQKVQLDEQSRQDILNHLLKTEPKKSNRIKKCVPVLILCSCLLLTFSIFSYSFSNSKENPETQKNMAQQTLSMQDAINHGIYIDVQGTIYNQEILDRFLKAVENKQEASIIIWNITREGDPIIKTIDYTQDNVRITYDSTQDTYGEQQVKTYQYRDLGFYNDDLCAYNNELTLEALDNDDALFITTVHNHSQDIQQSIYQDETFLNKTYDNFPEIMNIISYLEIDPSEVKTFHHTKNELFFGFYLDSQENFYNPALYDYVNLLEKQGYEVSQADATISSTFELKKDHYTITITVISDDEEMYNDWKNDNQEAYVQKMDNENILYKIAYNGQ